MATDLREKLKTYFGYDSFRPLQEEVIRHTLSGGDSLVLMPTGGGKSLCFQISALCMDGMAIVVSPLISLMKDQVESLRENGISAEALNSSNDEAYNRDVIDRCIARQVKLLYISPERLVGSVLQILHHLDVSLFAIDEAHCISSWGHDFRPEYTQLKELKAHFPGVPIMALTATADKVTKDDILLQLNIAGARTFVSSFDRPNLSLAVKRGYSARDKLRSIKELIHRHSEESGIIYCLARKTAEKLSQQLSESGITCAAYHAGLSTERRNYVQESFVNDRIQVVCATIAFGMGIDKSNVRFVVHYNLPKSIENYYQEIGRGGRDGMACETVLYYNLQDIITLRKFADESGQQDINSEKLQRMQEYAEAQVCRRRILLNYFGETSDISCDNCDVCNTPPLRFDGTVLTQKALSAIARTNESIGVTTCIDLLRGNLSADIITHHYNEIKTFGAGRELSARDWHDYLLQMLQMGFFEIAYKDDRHLHITPLGNEVLRGARHVQLAMINREDLRVKTRSERARGAQQILPGMGFVGEDMQLFSLLRDVRKQISEEIKKPAYVIMHDKSLHAMATSKPTTLSAFADTFGIGQAKARTYGKRFIDVIREYMGTEEPEPPTIPESKEADISWFGDYERELDTLLRQKSEIEERIHHLREEIVRQMEVRKSDTLQSELFTVNYYPAHLTTQFDSKTFREENAELYTSYCVEKEKKASIVIRQNKQEP